MLPSLSAFDFSATLTLRCSIMLKKQCLLTFTLFCCFFTSFVFSQSPPSLAQDPESFYNMIEIICSEGYSVQEHEIITDDGYILKTYRIPNGKRRPKIPKKRSHYQQVHLGYHPDFANCVNESLLEEGTGPPVLFSHGLSAASDCWVLQGHGYDLAFQLAEKGYDVWFTNSRGDFYSKAHTTLKTSQDEFWDFSFHESGIYDMPNTIDYILKLRGLQNLSVVGHSLGTTIFFVMTTARPEYNEKVRLFVGLTPVAHIRRSSFTPAKKIIINSVFTLLNALWDRGVREYFPRTYFWVLLTRGLCQKGSPFQDLCYDVGFFFTGFHSKLLARKKLSAYLAHSLSGSSIKTLFHFGQILDAPRFQWYDYGTEENFRRYGQAEPPEYDLKKITCPVALYYSRGDFVANIKDVTNLQKYLPNIVDNQEFKKFNHIDFIWAYNAKDSIYPKVIETVEKFNK